MQQITLPEILMAVLALLCLVAVLAGLRLALTYTGWPRQKQKKIFGTTALFFALWVVVVGVLAQQGLLSQFDALPPRPLLVVFLPIAIAVYIAFTKSFKTLLQVTPLHWLVLFQSFRIVVELLLWQAFEKGLIPVQMSFEGRNFDVVTGVLALVAGLFIWQRPRLARFVGVVFNVIGLALLINIMVVSILSMPTPFRYFTEGPANTAVTTFPFVYLPAVLVVLAFTFHVFSLRQLWLHKKAPAAQKHTSGAPSPVVLLANEQQAGV